MDERCNMWSKSAQLRDGRASGGIYTPCKLAVRTLEIDLLSLPCVKMPCENPPPTPIISHTRLPGSSVQLPLTTFQRTFARSGQDWDTNAISTAQDQLSTLLTTIKSHGARPPSPADPVFSSACFRNFPQRDFTSLVRQIEGLNGYLRTFSDELNKCQNPMIDYVWSPSQVVGFHADTLEEVLSLDPNALKDAHKALNLASGFVFLSEEHKPILRAVSEGGTFIKRLEKICALLKDLSSRGQTKTDAEDTVTEEPEESVDM